MMAKACMNVSVLDNVVILKDIVVVCKVRTSALAPLTLWRFGAITIGERHNRHSRHHLEKAHFASVLKKKHKCTVIRRFRSMSSVIF